MVILFGLNAQGQEIDMQAFEWEKRVLLVISDDSLNEKYLEQLKEFQYHKSGLNERKLVIIEVLKNKYRIDEVGQSWKFSNSLYKKYSNTESGFQIILIGLDGGVKVRKYDVLQAENLFSKIDGMPIRRSELRKMKSKGGL